MEKITEEEVDGVFERVYMNVLSKHHQSTDKYQPTHYTRTLSNGGFDKVKYYRLNSNK